MSNLLIVGHLSLDHVCNALKNSASFDVPQGAALGSALGAFASGGVVALAAKIGNDYPDTVLQKLKDAGIDLSAVSSIPSLRTLKFWLLREGIDRCVDYPFEDTPLSLYTPEFNQVPSASLGVLDGVHICPLPLYDQIAWATFLRPWVRVISVDPQPFRYAPPGSDPDKLFRELLDCVNVLSISSEDFPELMINGVPEMLRRLFESGVAVITIKMGRHGSVVAERGGRYYARVRSLNVEVIDETGAGDAYAGSFLAVYAGLGNCLLAAKKASVIAASMIGAIGMLHLLGDTGRPECQDTLKLDEIQFHYY